MNPKLRFFVLIGLRFPGFSKVNWPLATTTCGQFREELRGVLLQTSLSLPKNEIHPFRIEVKLIFSIRSSFLIALFKFLRSYFFRRNVHLKTVLDISKNSFCLTKLNFFEISTIFFSKSAVLNGYVFNTWVSGLTQQEILRKLPITNVNFSY